MSDADIPSPHSKAGTSGREKGLERSVVRKWRLKPTHPISAELAHWPGIGAGLPK